MNWNQALVRRCVLLCSLLIAKQNGTDEGLFLLDDCLLLLGDSFCSALYKLRNRTF
jgi:hypothetical protein